MMLSREEREEREITRMNIIAKAVAAAERVILEETDGSNETLLWLTLDMARVYTEKGLMMATASLNRKELMGDDSV
ncbi:MAG TPA: hypothetical protein VGP83_17185 [Pyrinomonadaceae bacterium]|jgi:hypothetical protein|nr:hypothetical protein [Pyrinomonadaceae bacterium]